MALEVADKVKAQSGTEITVINPGFVSGLDTDLLDSLKKDHSLVITIEDGEVMSGYGQRLLMRWNDAASDETNR